MAEGKPIFAALMAVQAELKAPKNQHNSFGKYDYRSAEDIIEAVKPLLKDNGLFLNMSDEIVLIGERYYVKATVKVVDVVTGESVQTSALAREAAQKKGMDESQVTGTASSYARKYALNGLFAIDDNRDADTDEYARQTSQNAAGARSQRNAYPSKGSTNDELRSKAMHALSKEMQRVGASGEEVSALCGVKFGRTNSRDLSTGELSKLAANLEAWIAEQMGGGK
ncbi:ERF family protein [Mitsuokella jalaludinii]|uniref:ERF family protein n=1 Tax=Mitsuokella jalaludinii TaxID=187979 RepID=UPI002431CBBA|nr:ERF family protein [Mitsuokella jalaludinii]MCI6610740.1 ERF family protein [Mitsuokella jalaludinii]